MVETAMFGMGCFWKPELLFSKIQGVTKTRVGFSGGRKMFKNPSYAVVCTGITKHVEVVKIWYDPEKVSYKKLLEIFWKNHNPTTRNRQGFDFGSQYRSVIFYFNEKQKKAAESSLKSMQKNFENPIVTEIKKASVFYEAEDYHQKYLEKRGLHTCPV